MIFSYIFINLFAIFSFSKFILSNSFFLPGKFKDFVVLGLELAVKVKFEAFWMEGWILESVETEFF